MAHIEYVDWDTVDTAANLIADHLLESDHKFKGIYGIERGGLVLAVMLSHRTGIPYLSTLDSVFGKSFIVVDDIADTGKTLDKFSQLEVAKHAYYVTIHQHQQTIFQPNYYVFEKKGKWIVYPWERQ